MVMTALGLGHRRSGRRVVALLTAVVLLVGLLSVIYTETATADDRPAPPPVCPEGTPSNGTRTCMWGYDEMQITASAEEITFPDAYPACVGPAVNQTGGQTGWCQVLTMDLSFAETIPYCNDVALGTDCISDLRWSRGEYFARWGVPQGMHRLSLYARTFAPHCGSRDLTCGGHIFSAAMNRESDGSGWLVLQPVTVNVRVFDDPDDVGEYTNQIYRPETAVYVPPPEEDPPVADFSWEITDPEDHPNRVRFTNTSTEPYGSVLSTDWDYGDGTSGTGDIAVHTYSEAGFYTVTLKVTSWGTNLTDTHSVTIHVDVPDDDPLPLVVNSVGDAPAEDPSEGCDTGAEIDGSPECTLRAAIETVNAGGPGGSVISFAVPGGGVPTIEVGSALPVITRATTIDATTQSGGQVAIDAGVAENAFEVTGAGSQLRGLVILDAPVGVRIAADDVLLEQSVIGAMPDGMSAGTVDTGVVVASGSGTRVLDSQVVTAAPGSVGVIVGVNASGTTVRDSSIGVNGDRTASLGGTTTGIFSFGPDTTIADNVVRGNGEGIVLLTSAADGSLVQGNRVGAGTGGAFSGQGAGIRVDGTPDTQVLDNVIVAGQVSDGRAAGISVTGLPQAYTTGENDDQIRVVHYDGSDGVQNGNATGTGIVVRGNTIGSTAAGVTSPAAEAPDGIQVWAEAKDVTVEDNHVHGPTVSGLVIDDASQVRVIGDNRIAPGAPDTGPATGVEVVAGEEVAIGTDVAGNDIGATTIGIGIDADSTSVTVGTNRIATPDGTSESVCVQSSVTAHVFGNVLDCARGVTIASEGAAITGPVVEHNTLTVDELGIAIDADTATVHDNQVSGGDTAGITVTGPTAVITDNRVAGARVGIALDSTDVRVADNTVTDSVGDGIALGVGPATVDGNDVSGSGGRGIAVAQAAVSVALTGNRIAGTTGAATDVPGGPPAPTIDAVVQDSTGGSDRTVLVISGLPEDGGAGRLELFANASCSDPEAEQVLGVVRLLDGSKSTLAVSLPGRGHTDHFTGIYTNTVSGSSSGLSSCGEATAHPDTDGDGVVDPIEDLTGVANDSTQVALVTDTEQILSLTAVGLDDAPVRFTDAAVTDDPNPAGHAGAEFPFGVVRFTLDGVTPGGKAAVRFVVIDGEEMPANTGYWKYGAITGTETEGWYPFTTDAASGTGAAVQPDLIDVPGLGMRRQLVVVLADGGRGDHDRLVDGRIMDPGAIAVGADGTGGNPDGDGTPNGLTPVDFPEVTADSLSDTGGQGGELLWVAIPLLAMGALLLLRGRARRSA